MWLRKGSIWIADIKRRPALAKLTNLSWYHAVFLGERETARAEARGSLAPHPLVERAIRLRHRAAEVRTTLSQQCVIRQRGSRVRTDGGLQEVVHKLKRTVHAAEPDGQGRLVG